MVNCIHNILWYLCLCSSDLGILNVNDRMHWISVPVASLFEKYFLFRPSHPAQVLRTLATIYYWISLIMQIRFAIYLSIYLSIYQTCKPPYEAAAASDILLSKQQVKLTSLKPPQLNSLKVKWQFHWWPVNCQFNLIINMAIALQYQLPIVSIANCNCISDPLGPLTKKYNCNQETQKDSH